MGRDCGKELFTQDIVISQRYMAFDHQMLLISRSV